MAGVHEVDDPNVSLTDVLPLQAASVLLQRSLPRNGHSQHKRIERWMVEAFANQLTG
jgi:hypothetical protein